MDNNQVKTAIESLGKTFEAFKETHQRELKEIKSQGSADPILLINYQKSKKI